MTRKQLAAIKKVARKYCTLSGAMFDWKHEKFCVIGALCYVATGDADSSSQYYKVCEQHYGMDKLQCDHLMAANDHIQNGEGAKKRRRNVLGAIKTWRVPEKV